MRRFASRRGFTLLELLLFSAIFVITTISLFTILTVVLRIQARQGSAAEVNQQAQFLIQTLTRSIERASLIEMAQDMATSTLKLRMASSTDDPTYIFLSSSTVYLKVTDSGAPQPLTSERVVVPGLVFTKHANPAGRDSVKVSFSIAFNSSNPQQAFSQTVNTAVVRMGPVVFASDVVPSAAGLFSVGTTTQNLWQSINGLLFFSGENIGIAAPNPSQKLEVNGGVRVNTVAGRPTCSASVRGTIWFTQSASFVRDRAEICVWTGESTPFEWVDLIRQWVQGTPLPNPISAARAEAGNGYLYVLGGYPSVWTSPTSTVWYARFGANGTFGAWRATTPLPQPLDYFGTTVWNGYLYVAGGYTGASGRTNAVYAASMNANGTLGAWMTTTALPNGLSGHFAAAANGYLYVTGGTAGAEVLPTSTVVYAPINSDHTVGAWASTAPMPYAVTGHGGAVYNNYLYAIGGYGVSSAPTSTMSFTRLDASGAVSAWTVGLVTSLPVATAREVLVAYNGFMYELGGTTVAGTVTSTRSIIIKSQGHLEPPWVLRSGLPADLSESAGAVNNAFLYIIGGYSQSYGSTPTSTVWYAPLMSNGNIGF
ncbi:MAG: hypothetical protein A3A43_01605 [Candidatus Liptonbacteria bacterium RIFCSPLOWO2_01_FULL_56_20]|uniref:Uncharacterized protein n=1 Tax=Candidatus Liptonbacteria bacterium RIFCSPLOWO2_01_FULL_56_20 TaxID=1798652 RepID=A0A1G2CJN3_9BACT|nr:MAG: hypothetical protein UY96_C0001G0040 [Parcubacteria group bacterium GW2011_GWB1_56_8]OGY97912.1 MAG: hypothetical protein A2681_00980 [Candidatus Liptonbacteria bacterium RIFCSPHIGHO2_01_FULL_56_18b]OGZ01585.1 MAG: hypothetical protein A3A43_01605 [Candidatus Liptonbacteria bacterium RIFCSPLOWO2_01_FULL_56_20]